ncbi:MAG: tRNA 2-thiouridine(34) synthase MnmA, partial [Thermomicrobium sp.]|nr:tRNA 2-thiouridine(34) synthase MnmA [Thermomicrobium sp.]
VDYYARAETPNPCILCNHRVRIPALLELADALGIEYVATGHYVRKVWTPAGWRIAEARDGQRDQSYVLYRLTAEQLERLLFPLGEFDKPTVRAIAREAELFVAQKPSSVDLCFAKTYGGIGRLVATRRPETARPGPLLDEHGQVVGSHPGIAFVTIGQRRGLQWSRPTPQRRYVAAIEPEGGIVRVAPRERILTRAVRLVDPVWHDPVVRADARLRYQGPRIPARVEDDRVVFAEPAPPLAPGQSVVLYVEDRVVGGGTAVEVIRLAAEEPTAACVAR